MAGTATLLGLMPGGCHLARVAHKALAVARTAHHRLNNTRETYLLHRIAELLLRGGEKIGRCRKAKRLGCQLTNFAAIHCGERGLGRGHHIPALFLKGNKRRSGDSLNLGDDVVGAFLLYYAAKSFAVEHRHYNCLVGHMHRRSTGIFVEGHYHHAIALQFDGDLLAELSAAQQ